MRGGEVKLHRFFHDIPHVRNFLEADSQSLEDSHRPDSVEAPEADSLPTCVCGSHRAVVPPSTRTRLGGMPL
jgi:hypothetical protein